MSMHWGGIPHAATPFETVTAQLDTALPPQSPRKQSNMTPPPPPPCLQFQGIGDEDDSVEASCVTGEEGSEVIAPLFAVRKRNNLLLVDELPSMAPLTDLLVKDLANEGSPQL